MKNNAKQTEKIRRRYNRIAGLYNLMDKGMTAGTNRWREKLFGLIQGPKVLEVGVGTGANLPYYPPNLEVTGIDFSPKMLQHAKKTTEKLNLSVTLLEMDVQNLQFPSNTFDTVITTCVFCSVPDPLLGLLEIRRVLKPQGKLLMLEHVLSCRLGIKQLMNGLNPLIVGMTGANINRQTKQTLQLAGFEVKEEDLWFDILKLFQATSLSGK